MTTTTPAITGLNPLQGLVLLEKDINGDLLHWSFPIVNNNTLTVLKSHSNLADKDYLNTALESTVLYRYSRYNNSWHYILNSSVNNINNNKVLACSIIILSNTYNPIKYQSICELLLKQYLSGSTAAGSPIPVLKQYLSIYTSGNSIDKSSFIDNNYDNRRSLIEPSLKKLFNNYLDLESLAAVFSAVLLKRRIIVYNPILAELLLIVRSLPLISAWHRQDWNILKPYCRLNNNPIESQELLESGIYIAGTIDLSDIDRIDLYDLFINTVDKTININPQSKSILTLTKYHKSTAEQLIKASTTESDQQLIKTAAGIVKQLLENIHSLTVTDPDTNNPIITQEGLSAANLPIQMQKFIYSVAAAEGMTKK